MDFSDALKRVGTSKDEIEAYKQQELKNFRDEMAPAREFAETAIVRLQKFFAENVKPIVAEVEASNIKDLEIGRFLVQLNQLAGKPNELAIHLKEIDAISWKHISSPPFIDRVDKHRRDDLVRHLNRLLTKFGDVEGAATLLVNRVRSRVLMLAEKSDGDSFPFQLPEEPAHGLKILTNLQDD